MSKSVVILSSVAAKNVDAFVKSGVSATVDYENGNVVKLDGKSDTDGMKDVFDVANIGHIENDTAYMVYEAPVPVVAGKYKGITDDPREFEIEKGTVFNIYKPQVGDEIVVSEDGIDGSDAHDYVILQTDKKLTFNATVDDSSLAYKKEGKTFISIGNERVDAYKLTCISA